MSNYRGLAVNPETMIEQEADFLDDYFGRHRYGVRFGEKVYPLDEVRKAGRLLDKIEKSK